jgi:hypothetical protein
LVTNYYLQVSNTAEALAAEGDTTKAFALLNRCLAAYPNERWSFDRIMLRPIELLWDLGEGATADSIARILVHNLKTRPEVVGPVDGIATDPDDRSIREAVFDRLHTMANKHQRTEFLSYLDAQPEAWPDPLVIKLHWAGATRPERKKR